MRSQRSTIERRLLGFVPCGSLVKTIIIIYDNASKSYEKVKLGVISTTNEECLKQEFGSHHYTVY